MVQINGSDFDVYDLDTFQSVLSRIASHMGTIPRYLHFPRGTPTFEDFLGGTDITVVDLLEQIKRFTGGIIQLRDSLQGLLTEQGLDFYQDVYIPFIAFNPQIEGMPPEFRGSYLLMIQTEVEDNGLFKGKETAEAIWGNRSDIRSDMKKEINGVKKRVEKQMVLFTGFQKLTTGAPYTKFELERSTFEFELDVPQTSVLELFNQLQLSPFFPFASVQNFFKILKDFVPPEEWNIGLDSVIFLKVLQKARVAAARPADYTDVLLTIEDETPDKVMVSMALDSGGQYLSRDEVIERFLSAFAGSGTRPTFDSGILTNLKENRVKGPFYFPKRMLEKYVLADMIMNDPLFSSMMSIDESDKATKQKDSIYIYFRHPKVGEVHANLTSKIAEKGDPYLRGKDIKGDFALGSVYTRVKISVADNVEAVHIFQEMLSKLLIVYEQNYDSVVDFYRRFLPGFPQIKMVAKKPPATLRLKDIAPEVFATDHSSKCSDVPEIISDAEVEERVARGTLVKCSDPSAGKSGREKAIQCYMRYPQTEEEGFIPRNYICNKPPAVYPGLITNTLSNRDLVPYLPCCYVSNHEARAGSAYRQYFYGEESTVGETTGQQALLTTNKFAPRNVHGHLPEDVTKVFNLFDYEQGSLYVRKGVTDSLNSFLECVMEGMYETTDILNYESNEERTARVQEVRRSLSTPELAAVCRQTMYDFTIEEIMQVIGNEDTYFSPDLFVPLLEHHFGCDIYVFSRVNRTSKLVLPRHSQAFYKRRRRAKTVFIYEHMGSKANNAQYPHCELIVRWQKNGGKDGDGVAYYAEPGSQIAEGVGQVYSLLRQSYSLNKQVPETVFPVERFGKLAGQGIDSYGKCRMIQVVDPPITILTSPIPPFALPVQSDWVSRTPEIDVVVQFAARTGITITGQSVVRGATKEVFGKLNTVSVSFPVAGGVPISGVPQMERGVSYPRDAKSALDDYNLYKKLSRYVVEYSYWLFSHYLKDNPGMMMGLESLAQFIRDKVTVDETFTYGSVPKRFNIKSGLMRDGKLVLRTEETLKRLIYTMRLAMRRMGTKLLGYHNRINIENYYLDITDFDQSQSQVILSGEDSIIKWAEEQKTKRYLYKAIQPGHMSPYFFRNEMINHAIFLAQNTDSLNKAIKIAEIWEAEGYNPGTDPPGVSEVAVELPTFTLYSYVSEVDVRPYQVNGCSTQHHINIVGYKLEVDGVEVPFYTTLLRL